MKISPLFIAIVSLGVFAFAQAPGTKPTPRANAKPGLVPEPAPADAGPPAGGEADTPEKTVARFFGMLQRNAVEKAYEQLVKGTKIAERPDDVKMLKSITSDAIRTYGAIGGFDQVAKKAMGERLVCYTYLSLGKDFPMRWRFYFYKPLDTWKLIDLRADDRLVTIFGEPEEPRAHESPRALRPKGAETGESIMLADALRFVRFTHTVFALPFALGSMLAAAQGWPPGRTVGLIVVAMVCARTSAMAFNRVADWETDRRNPRTAGRHKLLPKPAAIVLLIGSATAFVTTTSWINPLCFRLSPVALLIVFFYSLTKRFTHAAQFFLGLALAVSPMGAWFAVTGEWAWKPCWLAAAVLVWVAGFDLIYATQDYAFDRAEGLHSMVVKLGIPRSLRLAAALHGGAAALLGVFGWLEGFGWKYGTALVVIAGALVYEHRSARQADLGAINRAFFWSNAFVGAVFLAAVAAEIAAR